MVPCRGIGLWVTFWFSHLWSEKYRIFQSCLVCDLQTSFTALPCWIAIYGLGRRVSGPTLPSGRRTCRRWLLGCAAGIPRPAAPSPAPSVTLSTRPCLAWLRSPPTCQQLALPEVPGIPLATRTQRRVRQCCSHLRGRRAGTDVCPGGLSAARGLMYPDPISIFDFLDALTVQRRSPFCNSSDALILWTHSSPAVTPLILTFSIGRSRSVVPMTT